MASQDRGDACDDSERSMDDSVAHTSDEEFLNDAVIETDMGIYQRARSSSPEGARSPSPARAVQHATFLKMKPKRIIDDSDEEGPSKSARDEIVMAPPVVNPPVPKASKKAAKQVVPPPTKKAPVSQGSLARHWTITLNNPPEEFLAMPEAEFKEKVAAHYAQKFEDAGIPCQFVCAGKEFAPTTGTPHLQMFISFTEKRRKSALIKVESKMCYLVSKGTPRENKDYCEGTCEKKGNVPNPFFSEFGEIPKSAGEKVKEDWKEILGMARKGDLEGVMDRQPRLFLTNAKAIEHIATTYSLKANPFVNPKHHTGIWLWSKASGVGKTSAVRDQFEAAGLYQKMHDLQWNQYNGEPVALLDDFSREDARALNASLKLWCDHLPFHGRVLFGTRPVHLRHFIVTSNYSIEDLFGNMGPEIYGPIKNRFQEFNWDDGVSWKDRDHPFTEEKIAAYWERM